MSERAVIYTRISRDLADEEHEEARKEQAGELSSALGKSRKGVRRQSEDCHTLAKRRGYNVVGEFEDNDISASTGSKKARPQYDLLLAAVRAGKVDVIVAYSNSRLTRRPRELEDLIDLHGQTGVKINTVVSGDDNLATADGRFVARVKGAADAAEAERTAERVRRAKQQKAREGGYRGGPRPYGYEKDGVTVREDEAEVIRYVTTAVLAGRSMHALARELNAKGLTTSTGKPWTQPRIKDVAIRPRNAGLIHHGRADGRTEGRDGRLEFQIVGKATWPAIVTEDEWRAVHSMLVDPSRRTNIANEPKWLLSNIALCGRDGCDSKMRATSNLWRQTTKDPKKPRTRRANYRCREHNHLTIDAAKTDDWIRGVVAEMVRDERIVKALTQGSGEAVATDRERRRQLVLRLEQTERDYDDDVITGQDLKRKRERITAEMEEIDARLASDLQQSSTAKVLNAPDPGQAFLDAPLDVQRAVLRSVMTVTVLPAPKRGGTWTDERLHIDLAA